MILITYGNSLYNAFLSDDLAEIVQNPKIGNLNYALTNYPFGFIRPVLYWLAFNIGGLNPLFFRLINIFFHTGSVFLIFILFYLLKQKRLGIIVGSLFAIHPAISESIVWISGGGYPQYAFFFLASFVSYILSIKKKLFYLLSLIFYLLSFMSHPQMPLPLFLIFTLWEFSFGNLKNNWVKSIPFVLIAITYILVTLTSLPERETTLQSMHYQQGGIDNPFFLIPVALTSYFELTIFPATLTLYHSELTFSAIQFIFRAIIVLIFFGLTVFCFKKNKFIFFWSAFFLITLSPTLTPFRLNWITAERYLYLPILGLLAIVGWGFDKLSNLKNFRQISYILLATILILLSGRTIIRNVDWKNEDNLWIATGKTSPSSPNTHNNLGDVYGRRGDKIAALREFQKATELKPNYGDAYHNLANTYLELDQPDKALENYQNALKFNPNLWQSYQNIGAIYYHQKQYDQAIEYFQKAIQVNSKNLNLRLNLGIIFLEADQKEKAKEIFNLILSIDSNNQTARQGLMEANK
ncbi:tetratricopeptide repeat protein [Candidatus Daviesbacteria bacterium]|nr:tetratricopeptide repeat protein [Candidatus Daviesbacteria bacterium]